MEFDDSKYVCTLDQASIKKAKDELNENPQDRLAAVQALREWILEQPHIKMPTLDTLTLLRFLRGAKFSQIRAREMVEGNLLMRKHIPGAFLDVDTHEKDLVDLMSTGYLFPLPGRTKQGCLVLLYRLGKLDDTKFEMKHMMRLATVLVHYMSRSEITQVNGIVFLQDFTGVTAKLMSKMLNKDLAKMQKEWQKNTPGRFKSFNYYNCGLVFETMMTFFRPFLPKKWLDRIKVHDTMESVYKVIPEELLPIEYLPDDYKGSNAGTCDELVKNFIAEVKEESFRKEVQTWTSSKFGVDLSKKPEEKVTQHFRKLNVD